MTEEDARFAPKEKEVLAAGEPFVMVFGKELCGVTKGCVKASFEKIELADVDGSEAPAFNNVSADKGFPLEVDALTGVTLLPLVGSDAVVVVGFAGEDVSVTASPLTDRLFPRIEEVERGTFGVNV